MMDRRMYFESRSMYSLLMLLTWYRTSTAAYPRACVCVR